MTERKANYFEAFKLTALVIGMVFAMPFFVQNNNFKSYAAPGANGGACINGWTGTCGNRYGSCNGSWVQGSYPWPCPHSGNDIWCCVPPPPPPPPSSPPPPTNVTGSCSGTVATVNWTPVSGQPYYFARIHDETDNKEGSYSGVITGSSFSFNNAIIGHKYSYWVHTTNAGGNPYSTEVPKAHTMSFTCTQAETRFSLDLLLHGVGKAGDSQNLGEAGGGNENLLHKSRKVLVNVSKVTGTILVTKIGDVNYDSDSGSFKGNIDMGNLADGTYEIRVKLTQSLEGVKTVDINGGAVNQIPQMSLVTGDINNDNKISSILDYNILLDCYSELGPAKSCSSQIKKDTADLNDDGSVNLEDMNLFLREITNLHTP